MRVLISLLILLLAQCWSLNAAELPIYQLTLKNHLFYPSRLEVPTGTKFKLMIENLDSSIEEFDSFDLNREKALFPGRKSVIYVGPLSKGRYEFFGEYHRDMATGVIIASEELKDGKNSLKDKQHVN